MNGSDKESIKNPAGPYPAGFLIQHYRACACIADFRSLFLFSSFFSFDFQIIGFLDTYIVFSALEGISFGLFEE